MQKLHVVGFTTEMDGLVLSSRKGSKSGGYTVAVDAVLAVLEEGERLPPGGGTGPASVHPGPRLADLRGLGRRSALSPREIQARLRAGRSLPEVAAEADVDEAWVWRFAAPVLAEQAKVVGRARALTFAKPRRGLSARPLGTSVRWAVADRGVRLTEDEFDQGWSAAQLHDQVWLVAFEFVSRRRPQRAEWQLDLREGNLVALNRLASALAYVDPTRRSGPPEDQLNAEPAVGTAKKRPRTARAPDTGSPRKATASPRTAVGPPRARVAAGTSRRSPPSASGRAGSGSGGAGRKALPARTGAAGPVARKQAPAPARGSPAPSTEATRAAAAEALAAKFSTAPLAAAVVGAVKVPAWKAPGLAETAESSKRAARPRKAATPGPVAKGRPAAASRPGPGRAAPGRAAKRAGTSAEASPGKAARAGAAAPAKRAGTPRNATIGKGVGKGARAPVARATPGTTGGTATGRAAKAPAATAAKRLGTTRRAGPGKAVRKVAKVAAPPAASGGRGSKATGRAAKAAAATAGKRAGTTGKAVGRREPAARLLARSGPPDERPGGPRAVPAKAAAKKATSAGTPAKATGKRLRSSG